MYKYKNSGNISWLVLNIATKGDIPHNSLFREDIAKVATGVNDA